MSPARAQTQTTQSRVERTNHEATAPPYLSFCQEKSVEERYEKNRRQKYCPQPAADDGFAAERQI